MTGMTAMTALIAGETGQKMSSTTESLCTHCNQPVPDSLHSQSSQSSPVFCCTGCASVWSLLHSCGLQQYYAMQTASGSTANRPRERSSHAYLDHEEFQTRHVQPCVIVTASESDEALRAELRLDGLKCGACVWLLEALPRLERGISSARVDIGRSTITIEWVPSRVSLSKIADRLSSLGYEVRPIGTLASRLDWRCQDRKWLINIALSGAISINVMALAFALYGADFAWMDDFTRQFLQWVSLVLVAITLVWPGQQFFRNAAMAIKTRRPHVDLPIALALAAGMFGGIATTILGQPGVYFESIAMLVFLLLVGRFVQFRQQRAARHEVELLCALIPQTARRVCADGSMDEIPTDALRIGDVIEVGVGESSSADGWLTSEHGHFDLQLLTGESQPVRISRGEAMYAGVRLVSSNPVRIEVTAVGSNTRAGGIVRMVDEALAKRPPTVEFANRIAGWFLLAVVVVAMITGICWWMIDPSRVLSVVVALLVVTCPCALGLATPLTMVVSLGKAARAGILVRGGDVLERIARVGTIVLDKTGTVTEGSMRVMRQVGDSTALQLAAALEMHSSHPIGQALVAAADSDAHRHGDASSSQFGAKEFHRAATCAVVDVSEVLGDGICGKVNGSFVVVGRSGFIERHGGVLSIKFRTAAHDMIEDNYSPTYIAVDGEVVLVVGLGDPLRADARALVDELRSTGWRVQMASGDVGQIVQRVGAQLGIAPDDVRGDCTPEDKVAIVRARHASPVVMVGDGVNDLPAMAAADVAIAVRQGTHHTLTHADVALTGGGLLQVTALMNGAARTMRTIHTNFAISIAYNLIGGGLAVAGLLNPLMAAILMPLSGLTVTAVALRMPRFALARRSTQEMLP